jgi:hypothetical protein
VNATKAAGHFGLPFFVITYPAPNATTRDVRLGWVEAWDDQTRTEHLPTLVLQPGAETLE